MVTGMLSKMFKRKPAADVDKLLQSVIERRVSPRYAVRRLTNLYVTQRPLSTVIVDISSSGARFATRLPREVGIVVGIEITADDESMTLPMRILWDRWSGGCFENGGTFVDLTYLEQEHLDRFVEWARENPPADDEPCGVGEMLVAKAMEGLPELAPV